jgi:hypothetical protein
MPPRWLTVAVLAWLIIGLALLVLVKAILP